MLLSTNIMAKKCDDLQEKCMFQVPGFWRQRMETNIFPKENLYILLYNWRLTSQMWRSAEKRDGTQNCLSSDGTYVEFEDNDYKFLIIHD